MQNCQVIVVGAGPVGTFAAYCLAERGIDVIVVEAAADCAQDMRASTFHPPTLEMLDELGIADVLIDQGLKAPVYQHRDRKTGERIKFDFSELADATKYPFRLQCEQFKMARLLSDKLQSHPYADVRFSQRLLSFTQTDEHVDVSIETGTHIEHIRTRYLIGADGANSVVRKWLDLDFDGFTYPEKFLTLSTTEPIDDYFEDLSHVNYISDPEEWLVLLRVPTAWRILVPGRKEDTELTSSAYKDEIFSRLLGTDKEIETNHRTVYRVHQRVVKKYNHNRAIVIGDAAHLNNPLGGFGMNSGLHDAWVLKSALSEILLENGDATRLLDAFDLERRTIMRGFIQSQTIRTKKMMEATQEEAQKAFADELKAIHADPVRRRAFLLKQSMLKYPAIAPEMA